MRELYISNLQFTMMMISSVAVHGVLLCISYIDMYSRFFVYDLTKLQLGYICGLAFSILMVALYQILVCRGYFNKQVSFIEVAMKDSSKKQVVESRNQAYAMLEEEAIFYGIGFTNAYCVAAAVISTCYVFTSTSIQTYWLYRTFVCSLVVMNIAGILVSVFKH